MLPLNEAVFIKGIDIDIYLKHGVLKSIAYVIKHDNFQLFSADPDEVI